MKYHTTLIVILLSPNKVMVFQQTTVDKTHFQCNKSFRIITHSIILTMFIFSTLPDSARIRYLLRYRLMNNYSIYKLLIERITCLVMNVVLYRYLLHALKYFAKLET